MDISECLREREEGLLQLGVLLFELHCDQFVDAAKTEHVRARELGWLLADGSADEAEVLLQLVFCQKVIAHCLH